jgi:hypothetical protein
MVETVNQTSMEDYNIPVGTLESVKLKPAKVKIVGLKIESVGTKGNKKLNIEVLHPDNLDKNIKISSATIINSNEKLENTTLWVNKDAEGKLNKNSTLSKFIKFLGGNCINDLMNKEVDTILNKDNYLTFKGY